MNENLTKILSRLQLTDSENTTKSILLTYEQKGNCIVHFLYFANIILNKLDKEDVSSVKKESFLQALNQSDFLLPDGIALRLLYKKYFRKDVPNLNGTDFLPYFLSHIPPGKKAEIFLYGGTPSVSLKSAAHIASTFGHPVIFAQGGFSEFDWDEMSIRREDTIRIFLVGRGSPLQEIWTEQNRQKIEAMQCLVFTVGGLLDFWSGTEKRAPIWMRTLKIEWFYRAISNPKKNLKKTLVSLRLLEFLIQK